MGLPMTSSLNPNAPVFVPAAHQAAWDSSPEGSLNPNAPVFLPASYRTAGEPSRDGWGLIRPKDSRGGNRSEISRSLSNTRTLKMEGEAACKTLPTLPDDLVEKIITMMPFPAIFKARCLSKTWHARTSSFSGDDEEAKRCLVPSFHKQVIERSSTWGIAWSIFMRKGHLIGYDRTCRLWQRMPSLSFLPDCESLTMYDPFQLEIQGALLFAYTRDVQPKVLYVANILTRSWKCLQMPRFDNREEVVYETHFIEKSSQAYKVILFGRGKGLDDHQKYWFFQIYDSKSDSWKRDQFRKQQPAHVTAKCPHTSAYVNGVLYMVPLRNPQHLMVYNSGDGTFTSSELSLGFTPNRSSNFIVDVDLVVDDNEDLLMIISIGVALDAYGIGVKNTHQRVLRIDPESGRSWQLACGNIRRRGSEEHRCIIDGNSITFGEESESRRVHQYNLDTNEWSSFYAPNDYRWLGSCFQPGVNPFMAV